MTAPGTGERDRVDAIGGIQRLASRLWPNGWHPGGLGWALARGELGEHVAAFHEGTDIVAWAAYGQHGSGDVMAQADPDLAGAATAAVDWLLREAIAGELVIEVPPGASTLRQALVRAGFVERPSTPVVGMRRAATESVPALPPGYSVRPTRIDEFDDRVEVHRAAWLPASLPWRHGHAPVIEPGATSSFTAASYRAVRDTWLYDQDLDLVAVAPDGSLAGCCIVWFDPASGVAEIEPMGVVPAHRRRGLAVALCHEAATRVQQRGGRELFINTGERDEYAAPSAAYLKAGFAFYERAASFVRRSP